MLAEKGEWYLLCKGVVRTMVSKAVYLHGKSSVIVVAGTEITSFELILPLLTV